MYSIYQVFNGLNFNLDCHLQFSAKLMQELLIGLQNEMFLLGGSIIGINHEPEGIVASPLT